MALFLNRAHFISVEKIYEWANKLPHIILSKEEYNQITKKIEERFRNSRQQTLIQQGLFYLDESNEQQFYHPRFKKEITIEEAERYAYRWAWLFPAVNPRTAEMMGYKGTFKRSIVRDLISYLEKHPQKQLLKHALSSILKIQIESFDINDAFLAFLTFVKIFNVERNEETGSHFFNNSTIELKGRYLSIMDSVDKQYFDYFNEPIVQIPPPSSLPNSSLQQISYGAPGTGKSHGVKKETEEWEKKGRVVRTTFHPDSDYSTFVGAYKPTTQEVPRYDVYQKPIVHDGKPVQEKIITYEFIPQAFLQAYVDAWINQSIPEFLVIEEINRGNCAQIFGDLFQLLDRNNNGLSDYAIRADLDLQKFLKEKFANADIKDEKVKSGEVLILPNNLYIRATMNTSDQSLFPIDSAFKRRWDWKYVPIKDAGEDWKVEVGDLKFDWWSFVEEINKHIFNATNSEDKQLGYFFCKASNGIINAETFVGKVVFYLWNDVFKDYGFDDEIFNDEENKKLSFDKFFDNEGKPNPKTIKNFMENLGIEGVAKNDENEKQNNPSRDKYSINGEGAYAKANVAAEIMKLYLKKNQDHDESKIIEEWKQFDNVKILTQEQYETNNRVDKETSFVPINLNNGRIIYVTRHWSDTSNFPNFFEKMNSSNWPYKIEIVE